MTVTEFAKRCGVSRVAIYKLIERGRLHRDDAGGIDITHPEVMQYIADRDAGLTDKHKPKRKVDATKRAESPKKAVISKPKALPSQPLQAVIDAAPSAADVAAMDS